MIALAEYAAMTEPERWRLALTQLASVTAHQRPVEVGSAEVIAAKDMLTRDYGLLLDWAAALTEALIAAHRMRSLQRAYFKARTREALIASKEAEAAFDALLAAARPTMEAVQAADQTGTRDG